MPADELKPDDLKADVSSAVTLLRLLDKVFPDRIDAETIQLLQELEANDLALAALVKGAEFLRQIEGKLPRR
jgi:hypothetical protein